MPTWIRGRAFRIVVSVLTGVALAGTCVVFLGQPAASIPHGGCGFALFGLIMFFGILAVVGLIGALATVGLAFLWRGSLWGPILLIPASLFTMGFYGLLTPVLPGQVVWGTAVVLLEATPAVVCALLVWPLVSRGRIWARLLEGLVVVALVVVLVPPYIHGITTDINMATMPPPAVVALTPAPTC